MKRVFRVLLQLALVIVGLTALSYADTAQPLLADNLLRNLISYTADHDLFSMATDDTPSYFSRENCEFHASDFGPSVEWGGTRADWEARAAQLTRDYPESFSLTSNLAVSDKGIVIFSRDADLDRAEFAENLPMNGEYPVNRAAIQAALKQEAYIGFRQAGRYLDHHAPLGSISYLVSGFCLWTKMPLALFFGWGGLAALLITRIAAWALLALVAYWVLRPLFFLLFGTQRVKR